MKILVTGGSGFLGSHIADALSEAGHEVVIFDLHAVALASTGPADDRRQRARSESGRPRDARLRRRLSSGCHGRHRRGARTARAKPSKSTSWARSICWRRRAPAGVRRFVLASSIYVYSNQGSFYRTTKQACEHLVHDYHERFGLDFTVLRFGSLYGPRADAATACSSCCRRR